jgi:hypothetical protein
MLSVLNWTKVITLSGFHYSSITENIIATLLLENVACLFDLNVGFGQKLKTVGWSTDRLLKSLNIYVEGALTGGQEIEFQEIETGD